MKRQKGFTSRYIVKPHERFEKCTEPDCHEFLVKCKCGNYGHYTVHKGSSKRRKTAYVKIIHSHNVADVHKGRNDSHRIMTVPLTENDITYTSWRIKPEAIDAILAHPNLGPDMSFMGLEKYGAK